MCCDAGQMKSTKSEDKAFSKEVLRLYLSLVRKIKNMSSRLQCLVWRRPKQRVVIKRLRRSRSDCGGKEESDNCKSSVHLNGHTSSSNGQRSVPVKPIRIATFNAALFAVASAVQKTSVQEEGSLLMARKSFPRGILRPSHPVDDCPELRKPSKSKLRVSINLPENEISLAQSQLHSSIQHEGNILSSRNHMSDLTVRSPLCFPFSGNLDGLSCSRTVLDVLREVDADVWALQDVKAAEEHGMRPLSDLANALGMKYVFAESWAPEYGNAILSKWPIKRWRVQKIRDDEDIRNVLKATIEVPWMGDINVYCTQLDYLDENWRVKQMKAILQLSEGPHILAGGLNSLDRLDYSQERWSDIIKYYDEIGKPKPGAQVMELAKERGYQDASVYAGDCEPLVIIAKGQSVQGTCKYGTRVDYILSSPDLTYKFVPGSYSVISSKGTSDHHIVKVDLVRRDDNVHEHQTRQATGPRQSRRR